jgi:transposase
MAIKIQHRVRTLRLKAKAEGYAWLNAAGIEVNQVWNYANATSYKAARPFKGPAKWLTAFDLDKLTAGATECFERIGSDTMDMLVVRTWVCCACGDTHDRDVNAARNILSAGRWSPSVSGNESSLTVAEPSMTYRRCEAWISALKAAA